MIVRRLAPPSASLGVPGYVRSELDPDPRGEGPETSIDGEAVAPGEEFVGAQLRGQYGGHVSMEREGVPGVGF